MRILLLSLLINCLFLVPSKAGEGMWLPLFLEQLNEAEMQAMGMKITAEDIYSINKGSLKDAIVHFGGFCTGEVISKDGLVITNHHCGYGAIQEHSSLENNYLQDGFWAEDRSKELHNEGLFVTFIVSMADVTKEVLMKVDDTMDKSKRQSMIDANIAALKESYPREDYQDVLIKPFFSGNQYFIFVTEKYEDVRLVGTPPSSIGKFGADTDNWEFPRHTGDFALFRIYTGPDGKPAKPSADNIPMQARHHLPVSLDGVEPGDFTMVFGFPGRTNEYLPAAGVKQVVNEVNPVRISVRDRSLGVLDKAMRANPEARIQYASKQSRIANGWKKWIGESQGIEATDGIGRKKKLEAEFKKALANDKALEKKYGHLLKDFDKLYNEISRYTKDREYVNEIMYRNVETFQIAGRLKRSLNMYKNEGFNEKLQERVTRMKPALANFYKDYVPAIDQEIAEQLLSLYFKEVSKKHQATYAKDQLEFAGGDVKTLVATLFEKSILTKGDLATKLLQENPEGFFQQLEGDYIYQFVQGILEYSSEQIFTPYNKINDQIKDLQKDYMAALMAAFPDRRFYPDANSTLRVTYGKVEGYSVGDSLQFNHSTYLEGLVAKYVPGDYEFDVPARLLELYEEKDYGPYADEQGRMPVCFLGSNHTTGGNSGSPVIDAHGNFIGINFDRTWHGTMSDINYDASICRNIMVDARYILFVIDKFAGATHLVEEMTLVHPKK